MTKMIKTVFCIAVWAMALFGTAYGFSDVDMKSDEGKAISRMQQSGYIQGFEDGSFRPDATLTRAEFVTIINKMFKYTVSAENTFSDVKSGDWFYNDVLCGVQAGYIKGHSETIFKPNDAVTREQVAVMMNRILNTELLPFSGKITDNVSDWARDSVEKLVSNRFFLLEEGGRFRGTEPITRGEACTALEKCIVDVDIEIQPVDLETMAREELEKKIKNIISVMETEVMPRYTFDVNFEIAEMVLDSMKNYLADSSYDYVSDAKETYEVYRKSGSAAREFKDLIYEHMDIEEISILFDFFYTPEMNAVQ